jgi:uncharacterized damage-inducible protein DinB
MTTPWTAPPAERVEPGHTTAERQALQQWLDFHRQTLMQKCAGLSAEQLKERAVPPSRLSLLGLVRHMTDVERWWFRIHGADQEMGFRHYREEKPDTDFEDLESADAAADLQAFREETAAADTVMADKGLDDEVRSHGHHPERKRNVRWLYLHMIEEYARHNGHADLLREQIDGSTGF